MESRNVFFSQQLSPSLFVSVLAALNRRVVNRLSIKLSDLDTLLHFSTQNY